MTIAIIDLTDGEALRIGPMALRVLEDGSNTDHRLGIVEITVAPQLDGPPQHIHRSHDETFYVISGTPTFTSGAETVQARPGMLVTVPPGTPHTFANPSNEPAVILNTVTPDRYIGYFKELAAQPPGPLNPALVAEIMSRYDTEVIPPVR